MGAWEVPKLLGAAHGGKVSMSDYAVIRDSAALQTATGASTWEKAYLRPEEAGGITFVDRDAIDRPDEAYCEIPV